MEDWFEDLEESKWNLKVVEMGELNENHWLELIEVGWNLRSEIRWRKVFRSRRRVKMIQREGIGRRKVKIVNSRRDVANSRSTLTT